jgi:hypothetical protein
MYFQKGFQEEKSFWEGLCGAMLVKTLLAPGSDVWWVIGSFL